MSNTPTWGIEGRRADTAFTPFRLAGLCSGAKPLQAVKASNRLIAIAVVASGYGGDMDEDLADELLDDMDFFFNKVCCRKIERMILHLNKLVEEELCRFS